MQGRREGGLHPVQEIFSVGKIAMVFKKKLKYMKTSNVTLTLEHGFHFPCCLFVCCFLFAFGSQVVCLLLCLFVFWGFLFVSVLLGI